MKSSLEAFVSVSTKTNSLTRDTAQHDGCLQGEDKIQNDCGEVEL